MTVIKRIFAGPSGLRAGWGIAFFIAIFATLMLPRWAALRQIGAVLGVDPHGPSTETPLFSLLREGSLLVLAVGTIFIMTKIEGRSLRSYGLAGVHPIRKFVIGLVSGMALCSVLVGTMVLTNSLVFDGWALHGVAILEYGLLWGLCSLFVGFVEEIVFRGYLQHTLARGIGFWPAAFCCSIVFGLAHLVNAGENLAGVVAVILFALFLSLCLKLTGSLWWGIGFHSTLDWAESFFYGVASSGNKVVIGHLLSSHPAGDVRLSGGTDGPEGSLICVGLVLLLILCGSVAMSRRDSRRTWPRAQKTSSP